MNMLIKKNGFRYISEQVSHHPPISATHAEKDKSWVFYQNSNPTTSFLGNALSLDTQGKTHVYFPKTKDHYFYTNPKTRIHNIIFGKMWIEHHGELKINNLKKLGILVMLTSKNVDFLVMELIIKLKDIFKILMEIYVLN